MPRPPRLRRWHVITLAAIAVVALLLLIAQDQETLMVRSPVAATEAGFVDYVASLVGAPVADGDEVAFLPPVSGG